MATHETSFTITGPFAAGEDAPLARAARFYEANGYTCVARDGDDAGARTATRGRPGAGWTSSDMTTLHTVVTITEAPEALELAYVVDVTGQRLSDEDRRFFEREAKAARAYLRGKHEAPMDLREAERQRAEGISAASMRMAWRWGVAAFAIAAIALIAYHLLSSPERSAEIGRSFTQPLPTGAYTMPGAPPQQKP